MYKDLDRTSISSQLSITFESRVFELSWICALKLEMMAIALLMHHGWSSTKVICSYFVSTFECRMDLGN